MSTRTKRTSSRFPVVCLECGNRFKTASMMPTCRKCGGSDVECDETPGASPRRDRWQLYATDATGRLVKTWIVEADSAADAHKIGYGFCTSQGRYDVVIEAKMLY